MGQAGDQLQVGNYIEVSDVLSFIKNMLHLQNDILATILSYQMHSPRPSRMGNLDEIKQVLLPTNRILAKKLALFAKAH